MNTIWQVSLHSLFWISEYNEFSRYLFEKELPISEQSVCDYKGRKWSLLSVYENNWTCGISSQNVGESQTQPKLQKRFILFIVSIYIALYIGLRRAVRRVHKSAYGGHFFVKIGTHTKFDLVNNVLGLFLLFGAN